MVNPGREFKVAVMGEVMMTRPISVFEEPDFLSMIKLFREADVAVTNVEGLFGGFEGYSVSTGTPMSGETWIAEEYKWAGFNLVSIANNHTMDYGVEGLIATLRALDKVRLAHAGAGRDLWEARQPAYLETKKGRVAMVASTSAGLYLGTHTHSAATESGNGLRGRPGVNPLRYDALYKVTPYQFDEMKKIVGQWRLRPSWMLPIRPRIDSDELNFLGYRIVESDETGVQYIPLDADVEGNLRSIRNAKSNASLVIASNHSHERNPAMASEWGYAPAEYTRKYARACIDAGADVYYGHGDHNGQGMEVYKGRPIFYSLANPIVTSQNIKRLSLEEYEKYGLGPDKTIADWMNARREVWGGYAEDRWVKAVVATFTLQDGELAELKLHPVDSSAGEPSGTFVNRGVRPLMARGEEARRIIERYGKLSEPFNTEIEFEDGVGVVKI